MRDRSYQGLKDAVSFGLISDKSTEKLRVGKFEFGHFSIGWAPYYGENIHHDFSVISWTFS